MEDLEAGAGGQAFGKELPEDLASPLVGTDQRRDRQNEAFGARVQIEPAVRIPDAVGQPVRQHVETQVRSVGLGSFGITCQACEQRLVHGLE